MADPAGFSAALGPIAALLVPVVAMLFVALRFRRRLRYPHGLLSARDGRSPAALLFRTLRLYGDAALDAACAIVVGLAIAGFPRPVPRRGPAVVIDTSLSMLAGLRGDRPLDEAARLVFSDDSPHDRTMFTLGFDPRTGKHILRDVSRVLKAAGSPQDLAAALESTEAFLSADFSIVADLGRRGFGPVTLVTDDQSVEGVGLDLRRLSARPAGYLYPASAAWDAAGGRSVVRFVSAGGAAIMGLWRVSDSGDLSRAKPEDWAIAPTPSGFELSFAGPGLWAVQWHGHVLPFDAPRQPGALASEGSFAGRIVEALEAGLATTGTRETTAAARPGATVRERGGAGQPGFLSVVRAGREQYLLPLRLTLGEVVAVGLEKGVDLALGPAALASKEAAIPFWLLREASSGGRTAPDGTAGQRALRRGLPLRVGDGYLYPGQGEGGSRFIIAPVGEYASTRTRLVIDAATPPDRRLLVSLVLAILYTLKIIIGTRSRERSR